MMNKNNKAKKYVVNTYVSWAEPKYQTRICTLEDIKRLQQMNPGLEIEQIYELGKEVKLKMELV